MNKILPTSTKSDFYKSRRLRDQEKHNQTNPKQVIIIKDAFILLPKGAVKNTCLTEQTAPIVNSKTITGTTTEEQSHINNDMHLGNMNI